MIEKTDDIFPTTYLNPVYSDDFPDPFVIKFRGEYFAYCTGLWHDGRVFGVLRSRDLVNWQEMGGAMTPLENGPPLYWAPEVTYSNGKFYLYYSTGNEIRMEIRVALSDSPEGKFIDSGKRLTGEDFAIDAHVFTDTDGQKYLFYATDFLRHTYIGTGTVVDKMIDFFTLEGHSRPVTRARYDWQIYDPHRLEKGGVRWHTVEGPFVIKRKGVYYEMFSGGNWQDPSYGVSFAVTRNLETHEEWHQFCDGENILPILRTLPGIVGPGHNSAIRGSNNQELFCIYHRWTENGRSLAIDRMDFAGGGRMFVVGATNTPQPLPRRPQILDFFDDFAGENWKIISGNWTTENNQMISEPTGSAELVCRKKSESFILETSWRMIEETGGRSGVFLRNGDEIILQFWLEPDEKRALLRRFEKKEKITSEWPLPADFDFRSFHLLRLEADGLSVKLSLDGQIINFRQNLEKSIRQFSFVSENCRAAFSGTSFTIGFENLFEHDDLAQRGWWMLSESGRVSIENQNLVMTGRDDKKTILQKDITAGNYELTVNIRLIETFGQKFRFGFGAVLDEKIQTSFISFEKTGQGWNLPAETLSGDNRFSLPEDFSLDIFRQFRFLKRGGKMFISSEIETIGSVNVPEDHSAIALYVQNASLAFDLIRLTGL